MSLFGPPPIRKSEKLKFFMLMRSLLGLGLTTLQAVEFVARNESNSARKKQYQEKIESVKKEGVKIEDALKEIGFLEEVEYLLLSRAKDAKTAIDDILEFQSRSNIFEKTLLSVFLFPALTYLFINILLLFAQPLIIEFITTIAQQQAVTTGVTPDFPIPLFLQDYNALLYSLVLYLILLSSGLLLYTVLYQRAPWLIYRLFPLKNLDDAPLLISTMVKINATTGQGMAEVAREMRQFARPKALAEMYDQIILRVNENRPFFPVFREYGFKQELVDFIEIGEKSQNLWRNMGHVVTLARDLTEQKLRLIEITLKPAMKYLSYSLIVLTLFQIFMLYFVITTGLM